MPGLPLVLATVHPADPPMRGECGCEWVWPWSRDSRRQRAPLALCPPPVHARPSSWWSLLMVRGSGPARYKQPS